MSIIKLRKFEKVLDFVINLNYIHFKLETITTM